MGSTVMLGEGKNLFEQKKIKARLGSVVGSTLAKAQRDKPTRTISSFGGSYLGNLGGQTM